MSLEVTAFLGATYDSADRRLAVVDSAIVGKRYRGIIGAVADGAALVVADKTAKLAVYVFSFNGCRRSPGDGTLSRTVLEA